MKNIFLFIILSQIAFPAFESAFKFQYFSSTSPLYQDSTKLFQKKTCIAFILPFGQPFLKIATLNYSHPFPFANYTFYLASTGDRLYQEIMTENKFEFLLRHNYNLAISFNTYLISIENYSNHNALSTGLQLKYSNPKHISYFIDYKNGFFLTQSNLSKDIPEIIHISIFHENQQNQFVFSIVKDMLYPMDYQFFWKNSLHPNLAINFGIINSSRELLGGFELIFGKISPQIFILNHPSLGITYGFKLTF